MTDLIIACVRTGTRYGMEYVTRLRNMVARHLPRPYTMVCLTDQPERCSGVAFVDIAVLQLPGWWGKMALFEPAWRDRTKVIYLDLDTVIIGDLSPLTEVAGEFAICENFTRLITNPAYPCKYNSSVMVIGGGMGNFIWNGFDKRRDLLMMTHARHGDQACIEELYPSAPFLQRLLPPHFFCNYRNLTMHPPKQAAVINFGGNNKPDNCPIPWVKEAWA
ncbi:hypothetical protein I6F35_06335 [Bradyrhizobium sp. BRP22]|uniref:hypothetical protein n=1 Tax=Bradyrhizobium sp. BRP22 TaxID=2793821 RepID=UPI001CD686DA|nr:hypothetical protein [Bradyrhizobium sp. BRP22]MCA1452838.1 hypothetical protein [Bradyrhizobium sp. BRP22]